MAIDNEDFPIENKKYKWTGSFSYQKNGTTITEYATCWAESKEELNDFRESMLANAPVTKGFPDDEPGEHTAKMTDAEPVNDFCAIHKVKMKLRTNDKGSWYSHGFKDAEGEIKWCSGKGAKA